MPEGFLDKLGQLVDAVHERLSDGVRGAAGGVGAGVRKLAGLAAQGGRHARKTLAPAGEFLERHKVIVNHVVSTVIVVGLVSFAAFGVWRLMFRGAGTTTDDKPPRDRHALALLTELPNFNEDLTALTAQNHRLAGSKNGQEAAAYIENRLRKILADADGQGEGGRRDEVYVQRFPVILGEYQDVTIRVDGGNAQTLYACRANLNAGAITPPEGITGQTIYAASGSLLDYSVAEPAGKIVVLDFDTGVWYWQAAFAMGAKAVLFVGGDSPAPAAWHHLNIPAVLPRFYLPAKQADELGLRKGSHNVTLHSRQKWRHAEGRNVIAVIRGRDPHFSPDRPDPEAILLAAPIDSFGEVPDFSPGARGAANVASLLGIAEYLVAHGPADAGGVSQAQNRPRRDIILCFYDGQAQFNAGARAFYGALFRKDKATELAEPLTKQAERFHAEAAYVQAIHDSLEQALQRNALPESNDAFRTLRNTTRFMNDDQGEQVQQTRSDLLFNKEQADQLRARQGQSPSPEQEQQIQQELDALARQEQTLTARLDEQVAIKQNWGNLQREINQGVVSPGTADLYRQVVQRALADTGSRLAELEREVTYNGDAQALADAIGNDFVTLHLSLDLADSRARWTVVHGDRAQQEEITNDRPSAYASTIGRVMRNLAGDIRKSEPQSLAGFEVRGVTAAMNSPLLFCPAARADSGVVARLFGVYNLAAVTTYDRLPREGQPCDTVAAMESREGNIAAQALELGRMIVAMGDESGLSLSRQTAVTASYQQVRWDPANIRGATAVLQSSASAVANRPAAGGVVAILPGATPIQWNKSQVELCVPGFEHNVFTGVDGNGRFGFGPISKDFYASNNFVAMLYDQQGIPTHVTNTQTVMMKLDSIGLKLFRARTLTTVGEGWYRGITPTQVLRAKSTAPFRKDLSLVAESANAVAVYIQPENRALKIFNSAGYSILNNQPQAGKEAGMGVVFSSPFDFVKSNEQSANDRWNLNETRLTVLRDNHIQEPSLVKLHSVPRNILQQVADAPPDTLLAKRQGDLQAADAINRRVYAPLVGVLNDLIVAVVFLLLLAMPFAYALERLIIGTPHIYRQIGYVVAFFLATFTVLYFVNPAFRIAAAPIIIFLAFAVIVLSGIVIFIMTRKLQVEVKRMQGLGTTVHSSDVSRLSTMMAAVNMGISTMRRRPIRTILTAVTVVLLTFTILTFASFSNTWGTRKTYSGSLHGPGRVLARQTLWGPMEENFIEMFRGRMLGRATVVPRAWVSPTAAEADNVKLNKRVPFDYPVATMDGSKMAIVKAIVGLSPVDPERDDELRALLTDGGQGLRGDGVYLPESLAAKEALDLKIGQEVLVAGQPVKVAGFLSPTKITAYTQLEGSSILPVDYQSSQGSQTGVFVDTAAGSDMPDIESASFVTFSPDNVAFLSFDISKRLGGRVRSFQIYPDEPELLAELGEETARLSGLPTYVGETAGVYRLYFTTLTQASGFRDLVIPVILGGLIVFATMLGSVSDREREIYTFSALGLAPPHVASLFFAEASVYAVVGGMGGYLLGQTVGRTLGWMANLGWLNAETMNYSSSNAIVTVLIVMSTVLISTIYPAIKASRSANPGVARTWRIGRPKGDLYDIVFPFTVSSYDITGVVSFLKEHFDNYSDTSLGIFATERAAVFRQQPSDGEELLGFEASVALAPFDLGVTQDFALLSRPSEIEGIDEVRILLKRKSGSPGDWRRANRVFVSDLRRQLLIWRALPTEVMEKYRQQTLDQWSALPVGTSLLAAEQAGTQEMQKTKA